MIVHLKENGIKTIALESTRSYWQTLYFALLKENFEVLIFSGHQTKNICVKTDVKDCQWIQKLHI